MGNKALETGARAIFVVNWLELCHRLQFCGEQSLRMAQLIFSREILAQPYVQYTVWLLITTYCKI